MAGESKHGRTDDGRQTRPAHERLYPPPQEGPYPSDRTTDEPFLPSGAREVLFTHLFQASSDGILLTEALPESQRRCFLDVNERICQILGYTRDEMLKLTPLDILDEGGMKAIALPLQKLQESGQVLLEVTLIAKDRRPVPIEASVSVVRLHERPVAFAICRDISERKRAEGLRHEGRGRLEEAVRAQTEQLRETIDRLQQEVTRRVRVEGQLRKLALELSETEERERTRLAEILHDDLQQTLAAAKFQLSILGDRLRADAESTEVVGQIRQMLKEAIEKSRNLSHELGPAVLSQSSLDDTFDWLARQMESKHGLVVHIRTRGCTDCLSEPVRAFLYKAAREILFNVVKHAKVSEAHLRLQRVRNQLRLTISDKGRGFDLGTLVETPGFGLLSVRERVQFLGGRMKIKSAIGRGSTFLIAIPDAPGLGHPA